MTPPPFLGPRLAVSADSLKPSSHGLTICSHIVEIRMQGLVRVSLDARIRCINSDIRFGVGLFTCALLDDTRCLTHSAS